MKNPKVSIVVPIYKSAKFIDGLMNSVLNQSFHDFELICVNDGSPDNSLELLENWKVRDSRVVIIDKPNGGVSSARNAGIDAARGEYLWFHDHDDYAFPETLETMYLEAGGRDFLIAGYLGERNMNSSQRKRIVENRIIADNIEEMRIKKPFNTWIGVIWRCLFKRTVITDNDVKFRLLTHEDTLFIYEYLKYCNSCSRIDFQGYVFRDTVNSLGSSHNYNVTETWLDLAKDAAEYCFSRFDMHIAMEDKNEDNIFNNDLDWLCRMHRLYVPHCVSFVTTGYHKDSWLPYKSRLSRWKYLLTNKFWMESNKFGFLTKFQAVVWYICRFRLYYVFDPLLLLLTKVHDKK